MRIKTSNFELSLTFMNDTDDNFPNLSSNALKSGLPDIF